MPKSEPVKTRTAKWKDVEYPALYANMMGIGMTPFDINIILGEVTGSDETSVTGTPKIKILLAPEQAVNLMKLLSIAVDSYAKSNGALRTAGAVNVADVTKEMEKVMSKVQR